jgi:TPR repeat protein
LAQAITADSSDSELLYWRAEAYLQTGSNRDGLAYMLEAANFGNPEAKNRVGVLYMTGLTGALVANPELGLKWLRECAAQGNNDCTHNLQIALQNQH